MNIILIILIHKVLSEADTLMESWLGRKWKNGIRRKEDYIRYACKPDILSWKPTLISNIPWHHHHFILLSSIHLNQHCFFLFFYAFSFCSFLFPVSLHLLVFTSLIILPTHSVCYHASPQLLPWFMLSWLHN